MGILVGFPLPNSISPRFCSCAFNQERRGRQILHVADDNPNPDDFLS